MAWSLKGSYVETCSCDLICPCNATFDHGATYDYCRVTLAFNIREGEVEGYPLGAGCDDPYPWRGRSCRHLTGDSAVDGQIGRFGPAGGGVGVEGCGTGLVDASLGGAVVAGGLFDATSVEPDDPKPLW